MTETTEGSRDGGQTQETFEEGKTYEVPPILANSFIDTGRAVEASRSPDKPDNEAVSEEEESETSETLDEEEEEEVEVTKERTSENSPWYQFREDGELITEVNDGEEEPITVLGEESAEKKREELEKSLNALQDADSF